MTELHCAVGSMGVVAPKLPLALASHAVESFFSSVSSVGGKPAIQILFEPITAASGFGANPVTAFDLHSTLRTLVGNPPPSEKVSRIGVLLAHSYRPRTTLFGVMFDRGFETEDDPNDARSLPMSHAKDVLSFSALLQLRGRPKSSSKLRLPSL